jgi:cobalt/nickel transport system ATP-binding protein
MSDPVVLGAAMSDPVVQTTGLAYAYPDGHQALYGVDLTITRGERVALLGPNGAGKTTLVLHLNGILTPGRGTVHIDGLEVREENLPEIRRRVGVVFQDPDDQLFMPTVWDDVAFGPANLGLRGAELAARVREALRLVGMEEHAHRPPHHLSFGDAGSRSRPSWRWSRRSSSSTSHRATWTPPADGSWPRSCVGSM